MVEAENVYDWYMENLTSEHPPVSEMLGFSKKEWTAHGHGASFKHIAQWREHGWPDTCLICGEKIIPDNYGWLPRWYFEEFGLIHIVCPNENENEVRDQTCQDDCSIIQPDSKCNK